MDKYEFNIKAEQMKKMADKGDYQTAMQIADTIDWRRVRNANLLSSVAEIYEYNSEYEEAKDILLLAFERAPVGKRFLFKLSEISVKAGDIQDAQEYYREFCDMSPDDTRQYLLRYMILKAKGASHEQLLTSLEEYTESEVDEEWLYVLAQMYAEAGMRAACVRTCDKISLLFGHGPYVIKALELKQKYQELTKDQLHILNRGSEAAEEKEQWTDDSMDTDGESISASVGNIEENNRLENQSVSAIPSEKTEEPEVEELQEEESDSNSYNMIIEAKTKEDGFKIALDEIKYFHDKYGYSFKVVKTTAAKLNEKGLEVFKDKIKGKDLVIEDAGELSFSVADQLAEYIKAREDAASVILVDSVDRFDKMAEEKPEFIKLFDLVSDIESAEDIVEDVELEMKKEQKREEISYSEKTDRIRRETAVFAQEDDNVMEREIRETYDRQADYEQDVVHEDEENRDFTVDEFVKYAQEYAKMIDCVLLGKTVIAIYDYAESMQSEGFRLTKEAAEEMIEDAADDAEKPEIGGFFKPKYDKQDKLILREENFGR